MISWSLAIKCNELIYDITTRYTFKLVNAHNNVD